MGIALSISYKLKAKGSILELLQEPGLEEDYGEEHQFAQ